MKITFTKQKCLSLIFKLLVAGAIILVDLLTKTFFEGYFSDVNHDKINVIKNVVSFVYVKNSGAAFGIFENNAVLLAIFSIIFLLAFLAFDVFLSKKNVWYFIGYSFIIGGAIGNMVDRIAFNYVRDFIYLDFMGWFPVFNVADMFLTIGVICFMIYIAFFMFDKKDKSRIVDMPSKDIGNTTLNNTNKVDNDINSIENKKSKSNIDKKEKD